MGYDLRPRNKAAGEFQMGAFSWCWMLDNGVGLPVGYGPGFAPGQFIYRTRPDGKCIGHNDGARISTNSWGAPVGGGISVASAVQRNRSSEATGS